MYGAIKNKDGTLTDAGQKYLDKYKQREAKKLQKKYDKYSKKDNKVRAKMAKKNKVNADYDRKSKKAQLDFEKEFKAVLNMSYKDMEKELRARKDVINFYYGLGAPAGLAGVLGSLASYYATGEDARVKREVRLKKR